MQDKHADEPKTVDGRARCGVVDQRQRRLCSRPTFCFIFQLRRHAQCLTEILLMPARNRPLFVLRAVIAFDQKERNRAAAPHLNVWYVELESRCKAQAEQFVLDGTIKGSNEGL